MGNISILSKAGHQDLSAYREQALNASNSSVRMSYDSSSFDATVYTTFELDVFAEEGFTLNSPIISLSKASGTLVPVVGGFYMVVIASIMDIPEKIYYYSLVGDSELLLSGKFVIQEHPKQS